MEPLSLDVPLHIYFDGATHLGTGRSEGLLDRTIQRDADGRPYVPGSVLKGALRMTAERLVGQLNEISDPDPEWDLGLRHRGDRVLEERCLAPRPEDMCQSRDPCVVCRLFGNVFTGPRLRVSGGKAWSDDTSRSDDSPDGGREQEAGPAASERSPGRRHTTDVLTRLRIDRRRKGAEEGALFTSEYDHPTAPYIATLTGTLPATPLSSAGDVPAELVLLATTVAATDQIGGEGSTGHGACRLRFGNGSGPASNTEPASRTDAPPDAAPSAASDASSEKSVSSYSLNTLLGTDALEALAWHRFMT